VGAFIDGASVLSLVPGSPFSVCDDLGADVSCQDTLTSLTSSPLALGSVDILTSIALQLSFDLTPDTSATIGLDVGEAFGGGAFFEITPTPVPVPPAMILFGSALGLMGWMRRRA